MMDIFSIEEGKDLNIQDTIVPKAANLLSVQLGALEYAPEFGIDLDYFLNNPVAFQNDSFMAYLVQRMSENMIDVTSALSIIEKFMTRFDFSVNAVEENSEGFIV